jgi:hypothetical protein
MTVYLVIPCQKYRKYTVYIWFWPTLIIYTGAVSPGTHLTVVKVMDVF